MVFPFVRIINDYILRINFRYRIFDTFLKLFKLSFGSISPTASNKKFASLILCV